MESYQSQEPAQAIAYATPAPSSGKRTWAAVAVLAAGLAMIILGGCFLIGILVLHVETMFAAKNGPPTAGFGGHILTGVLYLLALACFVGAVALIVTSLSWLRKIVFG